MRLVLPRWLVKSSAGKTNRRRGWRSWSCCSHGLFPWVYKTTSWCPLSLPKSTASSVHPSRTSAEFEESIDQGSLKIDLWNLQWPRVRKALWKIVQAVSFNLDPVRCWTNWYGPLQAVLSLVGQKFACMTHGYISSGWRHQEHHQRFVFLLALVN